MTVTFAFSLNVYFMYNMCLLHYNIIQWDSEESQLTYLDIYKTCVYYITILYNGIQKKVN